MKSCRKNRKPIVWLAMNALDAAQAEVLRDHLRRCEGCRQYLEEISMVKHNLGGGHSIPEIEAPESLHKRIVLALRASQPKRPQTSALEFFQRMDLRWRAAVAALALVALSTIVLSNLHHAGDRFSAPTTPQHAQGPATPQPAQAVNSDSKVDLPPTIANYRAVANQSLDELDELLTRQGKKPIPTPPAIRATLALVNMTD